jgi:hypothetical protein
MGWKKAIAVAVASLVAVSCGGGDGETASEDSETTTTSPATPTTASPTTAPTTAPELTDEDRQIIEDCDAARAAWLSGQSDDPMVRAVSEDVFHYDDAAVPITSFDTKTDDGAGPRITGTSNGRAWWCRVWNDGRGASWSWQDRGNSPEPTPTAQP